MISKGDKRELRKRILVCNFDAMAIVFDDSISSKSLYPFTATRSAADIRIGILTIREKWKLLIEQLKLTNYQSSLILSQFIPSTSTALKILQITNGLQDFSQHKIQMLQHPWNIFQYNDWALREDFELVTKQRISEPIPASNSVINRQHVFIEEGAKLEYSIINASTGPVYIGKNAEVQEGCMIRGPFALCEGAVLKMGSKVYGATTIGPYCVAGGEIKNVVMFANSNKGHDGYLGDSVIGEWCNLGAGTSNSNVLNTAGNVKAWNQELQAYTTVGLKCGLLMGDYSRAAINTSFNTGTVVGVGCNIFLPGFPPKFVRDFTWGAERYLFEKLLTHITNWKKLKGSELSEAEIFTLQQLYDNP